MLFIEYKAMIRKIDKILVFRAVATLLLVFTSLSFGFAQSASADILPKGNSEYNDICTALKKIKGEKLSQANCRLWATQSDQDKAVNKICDKYGDDQLKSKCSAYTQATAKASTGSDVDPGYRKIFDDQICAGLKTISKTDYSKYCTDYINQAGQDKAVDSICNKYGSDGNKKLADECAAYKNYSPGSFTPSVGAGSNDLVCDSDPKQCVDPAADPTVKCDSDSCDFIKKYVNPAIKLFSILFGLIAVISLILGGINYSTSEGDPQKVSRAKNRILNTIIAVIAYMFMYAFLQFLIPGGAFK